MLLHPAEVHPELGVLAHRRADSATPTSEPATRSLPADRLRVGLGREHLRARLLDQAPPRDCNQRTKRRIRSARSEVRLSIDTTQKPGLARPGPIGLREPPKVRWHEGDRDSVAQYIVAANVTHRHLRMSDRIVLVAEIARAGGLFTPGVDDSRIGPGRPKEPRRIVAELGGFATSTVNANLHTDGTPITDAERERRRDERRKRGAEPRRAGEAADPGRHAEDAEMGDAQHDGGGPNHGRDDEARRPVRPTSPELDAEREQQLAEAERDRDLMRRARDALAELPIERLEWYVGELEREVALNVQTEEADDA